MELSVRFRFLFVVTLCAFEIGFGETWLLVGDRVLPLSSKSVRTRSGIAEGRNAKGRVDAKQNNLHVEK